MALHRFIVVILLACVVCPTASSQSRANDVRVMSYNIRYGTANDGENHWDKRKEFLLATIQTFDPDLLGTQETLGFQRDLSGRAFANVRSAGRGARRWPREGRNDGALFQTRALSKAGERAFLVERNA